MVIGAGAERETHRKESAPAQRIKFLARQSADKGVFRSRPVRQRDRRAGRGELNQIGTPVVGFALQADADNSVRPKQLGLLLQARECKLAGVGLGVGEGDKLGGGIHRRILPADMVDSAAHDLPERADTFGPGQREFVDTEVTGKESRVLPEFFEAHLGLQRKAAF